MQSWQSKTAFVVHFLESTDIESGQVEGKVEHITSYKAARFHSVDQLLAFMACVLAECKDPDGPRRKTTNCDTERQ